MNESGNFSGLSSFVAEARPINQSDNARGLNFVDARAACVVCSKQHDIWKGSKCNGFTYEEMWRVVWSGGLCNKGIQSSFKSVCLRDRGRLGNEGRPKQLENLCELLGNLKYMQL